MDSFTQVLVEALIASSHLPIHSLSLLGSKLLPEDTDFWADTDLLLVLEREFDEMEAVILDLLSELGKIQALEVHGSSAQATYRICLEVQEKLELIDLSVYSLAAWLAKPTGREIPAGLLHGKALDMRKAMAWSAPEYGTSQVNSSWFLFYQAVKKFMRNDMLIGWHLLLEITQECLVLEMLIRDKRKQTNVHKYGEGEKWPLTSELKLMQQSDRETSLDMLAQLAKHYDAMLPTFLPGYESRLAIFLTYLNNSLKQPPHN